MEEGMIKFKALLGVAVFSLFCLPVGANEPPVKPDTSSIKGTVKVKGRVRRAKKIQMSGDPKCMAMHATPPKVQKIVATKKGLVKWSITFLLYLGMRQQRKADLTPRVERPPTPLSTSG